MYSDFVRLFCLVYILRPRNTIILDLWDSCLVATQRHSLHRLRHENPLTGGNKHFTRPRKAPSVFMRGSLCGCCVAVCTVEGGGGARASAEGTSTLHKYIQMNMYYSNANAECNIHYSVCTVVDLRYCTENRQCASSRYDAVSMMQCFHRDHFGK